MGLKNEQYVLLSKEDQNNNDNTNHFQTQTGESFDFNEGCDSAVYEVHKQYKLRTRTIDIPEPRKPQEGKQPNKIRGKAAIVEHAEQTVPSPQQITVEDVIDYQNSKNQPLVSFPSKETSNNTPKSLLKAEKLQGITHHNDDNEEKNA